MHLQKSKIKEFMRCLGIKPESVILFGSFARGDYAESSDIDILVVLRSDLDWFDRQHEIEIGMDALIYTPEELEKMFAENNGFILDVLEDGIILQDNGYWEAMKRKFLDRKRSGIIKKIEKGWKISKGNLPGVTNWQS